MHEAVLAASEAGAVKIILGFSGRPLVRNPWPTSLTPDTFNFVKHHQLVALRP